MRTAASPVQGRPAITNLKHKTGGRKPHLPRLISACVWLTHCPAAPANAPGQLTAHVQAGCLGWVSTRTPLDCACTLQYLPGLPEFQVADQGQVPRDHQSHTDQSARPTGLGFTEYSVSSPGPRLPPEDTTIYLGSGLQLHRPPSYMHIQDAPGHHRGPQHR